MGFTNQIANESRRLIKKAAGSVFWLKKAVTSSDISLAGLDLTAASSGGDLAVEEVVLKTDQTTGLAGGTTLKVISTNSTGTDTVLFDLVANLGIGKTSSFVTARERFPVERYVNEAASNAPTILEEGKKLQIKTEGTAGTGAGTVDVWMKFRRVSDDANIVAA